MQRTKEEKSRGIAVMSKPQVASARERVLQLAGGAARVAVAAGATAAAAALLVALDAAVQEMAGWLVPLEGLTVNLLLFEWAVVWFMALPIYPPERYFAARRWKRMNRLYERLGIRGFGRLVIGRIRFSGRRRDLFGFVRRTRHAEAVHLLASLGVAVFAAGIAVAGRWDALLWTGAFSLPIHLYPIMLQRYNRTRAERLLRLNRHAAAGASPRSSAA